MRSLVGIPLLILNTVVMGALSLLALPLSPSGRLSHVIARYWSRVILWSCGVRVRVEGSGHIGARAAYVVMCNHQSMLDIPILFAYLPLQFRIMAKRILFLIPFLGWHLWLSGHVAIDRKSLRGSARGLLEAARRVRNGISLVLFPEGTRSPDGRMAAFKLGGFRLAQEHGLPILPVTIDGSCRVLPKGSAWLRRAPSVVLLIHPVVSAVAEVERADLADQVRQAIARPLGQ